MFECFSCSRRFREVQQLRGHLRHCEYHKRRRLKEQAEAEARNQPAQPASDRIPSGGLPRSQLVQKDGEKPLSRRPGRDSNESLLLLLDVYETLPQLKNQCVDYAAIARLFRSDITGHDEWTELYWMLDECERDYQQMIIGFRLNHVLLYSIYHRMLAIKERWLRYRARELRETLTDPEAKEGSESNGIDDVHKILLCEAGTMWEGLMIKIKKMLVASR